MSKKFIPRLHGLPLTALNGQVFDDIETAIQAVMNVIDSRYDTSLCQIHRHKDFPDQWTWINFPPFEDFSYPITVEIKAE
jgi:hypothetical protein